MAALRQPGRHRPPHPDRGAGRRSRQGDALRPGEHQAPGADADPGDDDREARRLLAARRLLRPARRPVGVRDGARGGGAGRGVAARKFRCAGLFYNRRVPASAASRYSRRRATSSTLRSCGASSPPGSWSGSARGRRRSSTRCSRTRGSRASPSRGRRCPPARRTRSRICSATCAAASSRSSRRRGPGWTPTAATCSGRSWTRWTG